MSRRIVLDASAAVCVVRRLSNAGRFVDLLTGADMVLAPDLYACEVANALWKYVKHGSLDRDAAVRLLSEANRLVDVRISNGELAEEALVAASVYDHPVYDMLYAVLARRHGATVMTMDRRLASALEKMSIEVYGAS